MKRAIPLLLLLLAVGCQPKLNVEQTVMLDPNDIKSFDINAVKISQTVKVSAKGDGGKFKIYLFLAKDRDLVSLNPDRAAAKLLDHKKDVTEANLSAMIPANEEAVVMLLGAESKKVEVKLKIHN